MIADRPLPDEDVVTLAALVGGLNDDVTRNIKSCLRGEQSKEFYQGMLVGLVNAGVLRRNDTLASLPEFTCIIAEHVRRLP